MDTITRTGCCTKQNICPDWQGGTIQFCYNSLWTLVQIPNLGQTRQECRPHGLCMWRVVWPVQKRALGNLIHTLGTVYKGGFTEWIMWPPWARLEPAMLDFSVSILITCSCILFETFLHHLRTPCFHYHWLIITGLQCATNTCSLYMSRIMFVSQ